MKARLERNKQWRNAELNLLHADFESEGETTWWIRHTGAIQKRTRTSHGYTAGTIVAVKVIKTSANFLIARAR